MNVQPNPELIDGDNPEWTAEMVKQSMRLGDLPQSLQAKLRRGRGPNKALTKERISIRLPPGVLQAWRASGPGWQTRMAENLSRYAPR
jgi:uncharacterized protein (DUF4415 family)